MLKQIAALALFVTPSFAAPLTMSVDASKVFTTAIATPALTISVPYPTCLTVQGGISLCNDGVVKIPQGMKTSAAARQFVDEIRKYWPSVCGPRPRPGH